MYICGCVLILSLSLPFQQQAVAPEMLSVRNASCATLLSSVRTWSCVLSLSSLYHVFLSWRGFLNAMYVNQKIHVLGYQSNLSNKTLSFLLSIHCFSRHFALISQIPETVCVYTYSQTWLCACTHVHTYTGNVSSVEEKSGVGSCNDWQHAQTSSATRCQGRCW